MTSCVYFLQIQPFGPVKIGFTTSNIYLRVTALQQTSPHELKWIGYFLGDRAAETAAHELLANSRLRNEWFHPTPEVMSFIKEKCPDFCPKATTDALFFERERQQVLAAMPRYTGGSYDMACRITVAAGFGGVWHFWKWLHREKAPHPDQVRRAVEFVHSLPEQAQ